MALNETPVIPGKELLRKIEFEHMPEMVQDDPFQAISLYQAFDADTEGLQQKFMYFRFEIEGDASKVQNDIHGLPSVELSNQIGGKCYSLCVFNDPAILQKVQPGDHVVISGNYLTASSTWGVVLKNSALKKVIKA